MRRSGTDGVEPLAVEERAAAAVRHPLLGRPEVVHEAERDVGHRRPVGDRERERVVRQPALGVLGAVERVDDHEGPAAAEVDAPALLADRGEGVALRVQVLEPAEDRGLRRRVDLERAVAALAARAGLPRAELRRGSRGEDVPQLGGRAASDAQASRVTRRSPAVSYEGARDGHHARAARGGHAPARAAARRSAAPAPARRSCWRTASPGWPPTARRRRRSSSSA